MLQHRDHQTSTFRYAGLCQTKQFGVIGAGEFRGGMHCRWRYFLLCSGARADFSRRQRRSASTNFLQSLEAELITIAGYYLLYDECPAERAGHFQIFLKESKIHIDNFSLERSVLCQK